MERQPFIVTPITNEQRVAAYIAYDEARSTELHPLEALKTPEEYEAIATANFLLGCGLETLGLGKAPVIPDIRIKIFEAPTFGSIENKDFIDGFYEPDKDLIYIKRSENFDRADFIELMLHESIHYHSFKSYKYDKGQLVNRRVGYSTPNALDEFDEGVVSLMSRWLMESGDTKPAAPEVSYPEIASLILNVSEQTANALGRRSRDVLEGLYRGLFVPGMGGLRDIRRVYGKSSLYLLGALGHESEFYQDPKNIKDFTKLIALFFSRPGRITQEELGKSIGELVRKDEEYALIA